MGIQVQRKPVVLLMTAAPTGPVSLTAAARGGPPQGVRRARHQGAASMAVSI